MRLEHWTFRQNVSKNKVLLKSLRVLLTNEIQSRKSKEPKHLDFRFLLLLSQWLLEQGGYTITPKGNNPGNVMGKGDIGEFHRKNNVEIVNGKPVVIPANFARFSTIEVGTKVTFDHLQKSWPQAYFQLLDGGTPEDYVTGLYPGKGKNYATQLKNVYTSGLRYRMKYVIQDYILVLKDDLKDLEKQNSNNFPPPRPEVDSRGRMPGENDPPFGVNPHSLVHENRHEAQLMNTQLNMADARKQEYENQKRMLEEQIAELEEIKKKFKL